MKYHPVLFFLLWGVLALHHGYAAERTVITSDSLEMQGTEERNFFFFRSNVVVLGTNLEIRCDELTVIAGRQGADDATVGEIGAIERIIAVGNVQIHQAGRSAFCGQAEVDPRAGTVTLSGNPRVVDRDVEIEGYMFILHRDQRRFQSIPDPNAPASAPSRSVVRLGALPDLGFSQDEATIDIPAPTIEVPVPLAEPDAEVEEP